MTKSDHNPTPLAHSHAKHWLLTHDIRDPKRLSRVWRYLRKEGVRMQHSIYFLTGDRHQLEKVIEQVQLLIDEQADDVRIYPLTENTRIWGLGTQFGDGENLLCEAFMDKIKQPMLCAPSARQGHRLSFL